MASIKYIAPFILLAATSTQAQSFSLGDLFGQASKQKNYYLQQIAAYNMLESELKQGYNVMKNGLDGIRDINTAELNAHTAYYIALKTPSSSVKNNSQVKDIFTYQTYISSAFSQPYTDLTADESNYVQSVKIAVLIDCNKDLTDLQSLLATGKLQMSDDERLKRLNAIHSSMLDKYEFSQSFTNSIKMLVIRHQQNANDVQTLQAFYENR
ncbi:MAG TPA: hypothetical protein VGN20_14255 [Mucilaginibacter sp.]|jgi:hypothetical protein